MYHVFKYYLLIVLSLKDSYENSYEELLQANVFSTKFLVPNKV